MNANKLCSQIMSVIGTVNKFGSFSNDLDAETNFFKEFSSQVPDEIPPVLPDLFKCCTLENVDFGTKNVELIFEHWPVPNVGDGCRVN